MRIYRQQLDCTTEVLSIRGDLDAFTVSEFRQATAELPGSLRLIIELGATFIDSAGLNALLGAVRRVREREGDAAVVCSPRVLRFLKIAGFDRVVMVRPTVDEARTALTVNQ